MSLLRSLVFLAVVACVVQRGAAQWPCPDATTILPCVCTADGSYEITMDCSNAISYEQLQRVFQTPFAVNDFKRLIIQPTDPFNSIQELPNGVFGPVTFMEVDITNTFLHTVQEEVFANSHDLLWRLNLGGNDIRDFPFETLNLYRALLQLDLSNNKLSGFVPNLVSEGLMYLDLSYNMGFLLTETAFVGTPYLEELRLNNMGLGTTTPANVFLKHKYLKALYLQNNGISGTLIQDFINPDFMPLTTVQLDGNSISSIHPLSVTGMNEAGTVSFRNNLIEYLQQEDWEGLVSQLSNANAIDTRDNPLVCGCDMVWLVNDANLMAIFHAETRCINGNYIVDLPPEWFVEHCP